MFRCYRAERELATAAADKARASSAAATAAREQGRSLVWVGFGLVGWSDGPTDCLTLCFFFDVID